MKIKRRTTGFWAETAGGWCGGFVFLRGFCINFSGGGGGNTQFWHGGTQRHTLRLHMLQGGNKATLPACGIAHVHLPTAATCLDDARHRGWAWKWDVRWKLGGMWDVHQISFLPLWIFNSCGSLIQNKIFFGTIRRISNITNLAVTSWDFSCL
jgi:hypothetical protein